MSYLTYTYQIVLFILSCLPSINGISTEEGSSYFLFEQPEYPRDCTEVRDRCSSGSSSGIHITKPDGYLQPFEVYCNNEIAAGGWTASDLNTLPSCSNTGLYDRVIQRRYDGSIAFKRNWDDYKNGFGFLSDLTNQAVYELRTDMILSNRSSFYVTYESFRISDEFGHYALTSADGYIGNSSCVVSTCPHEWTHEGCSCQQSCNGSYSEADCHNNCVEICVRSGCFVSEKGDFISNGESYVNINCTENCTCFENQLSCNSGYECSTDASCTEKNSVRKCYCNEGFDGDGENCTALFTDCYDAYQAGHTTDGTYTIIPMGWPGLPFNVSCDMTTAGGGWTVFQRRTDGVTDFYRHWDDYKYGFGSVEQGNDFWLGNEKIYYLTNQKAYKLRVDIRSSSNASLFAEYATFSIKNSTSKYQLSVASYSGDAGDSLISYDNGGLFTTRDRDNDNCSFRNCAEGIGGAGWYTPNYCYQCFSGTWSCSYYGPNHCLNRCSYFNLNGVYNGASGKGIYWYYHCNLRFADMKLRPSSV